MRGRIKGGHRGEERAQAELVHDKRGHGRGRLCTYASSLLQRVKVKVPVAPPPILILCAYRDYNMPSVSLLYI